MQVNILVTTYVHEPKDDFNPCKELKLRVNVAVDALIYQENTKKNVSFNFNAYIFLGIFKT